jgi:hypothetical protein
MLWPDIDLPLISPRTKGFVVTVILYMWLHTTFVSFTFLVLCFFYLSLSLSLSLPLSLNPVGGSAVLCLDVNVPQKLVDSTEFIRCILVVLTLCKIHYAVKYF